MARGGAGDDCLPPGALVGTAARMVGGLGMGFTLRATLDLLPPGATVRVVELVPAVVEWNRGPLGSIAGHPLNDRRVRIEVGDVGFTLRANPGGFDAILLDVDNGPSAFTTPANEGLYDNAGVAASYTALKGAGRWRCGRRGKIANSSSASGFMDSSPRSTACAPASRKAAPGTPFFWVSRTADRLTSRACDCSGLMFDSRQAEGLHDRRNVDAEASAQTLLQTVPASHGFFGIVPRLRPCRPWPVSARPQSAQLHPISSRLEHGMEVTACSARRQEGTVLPTVHTSTCRPSLSSTCIVYSDVPGGASSTQGLAFVRFLLI